MSLIPRSVPRRYTRGRRGESGFARVDLPLQKFFRFFGCGQLDAGTEVDQSDYHRLLQEREGWDIIRQISER
jgi:hypothetical protein